MLKIYTICACLLLIVYPTSGHSQGSQAIYGVQKARSNNLSGVKGSKNILGSKNSTKVLTKGSKKLTTKSFGASKFNSRVYSSQGGLSKNPFGRSNVSKETQAKAPRKQRDPRSWGNIDTPPEYDVPYEEDESETVTPKEIGKF